MFHEMTLKLYFMKCLERKISQCILPFKKTYFKEHLQTTAFRRALQKAIYKTKNTATGNGMRGMRGTWRMFTRIPGNLLEDSGECYHFNIPGNVPKDSGECSNRFRRMFKKIPGNVRRDSGEYSRGFREMFKKIPVNAQEDFWEYKFIFIL